MSQPRDLVAAWQESQPVPQLPDVVMQATVCAPEPAAWRLYSRRLDRELWVARDADAARALDQDGVRGGLPVVLAADLESFPIERPSAMPAATRRRQRAPARRRSDRST
jgi:hypothetical protein